jgi:hypothetical protein
MVDRMTATIFNITGEWLTFGVALYAAAVSTGVATYQFDRPRVKVVLAPASAWRTGEERVNLWGIRVVNHRNRPITIQMAGPVLDLGEKTRFAGVFLDACGKDADDPFPVTLGDGEAVEFFIARGDDPDAAFIGAWARDSLNRVFDVQRGGSRNPWARLREWRLQRQWIKDFPELQRD